MSAIERLVLATPRHAVDLAAMALTGAALLLVLLMLGGLALALGHASAAERDEAATVPANEN